MSNQEYLHVFESILYGAIVTQVLVGWSKMIAEKGNYKFYWIHLLASIALFLGAIHRYFNGRELVRYDSIESSYEFLFTVVMIPSLFFISLYQIFPKSYKNVNFKELIIEKRASIFIPIGLYMLSQAIFNITFYGWHITSYLPHLIFISIVIAILFKRSLRLIEICTIYAFIASQYYFIFE